MGIHLIADEGNSFTKIAWFENDQLSVKQNLTPSEWMAFQPSGYQACSDIHFLFSSVKQANASLPDWARECASAFILSHLTPLPIGISYETPLTLGTDRIANAVGAMKLAGSTCLVVDCGSCLTFTLLRDGLLEGGSIAPGLHMRFQALNAFTGNLPMISEWDFLPSMIGKNTKESLVNGVIHGIVAELDESIARWRSEIGELDVILTGGDSTFFAQLQKSRIFANPDLTLIGLNEILKFNLEKH